MVSASTVSSRYKLFNIGIVFVLFSFIVAMAAVNYFLDPYGVFSNDRYCRQSFCNSRIRSVQHLLNHKRDYDGLLIGSSRMGLFPVSAIEAVRPGKRYYNLSAFSMTTKEIADLVAGLDRAGVRYHEAIIGIDLYNYISPPTRGGGEYIHHPAITGDWPVHTWLKFLGIQSAYQVFSIMISDGDDVVFDFNTGSFQLPRKEKALATGTAEPPKVRLKGKDLPALPAESVEKVRWENFALLKTIMSFMDKRGIDSRCLIYPHHPNSEISLFKAGEMDQVISQIATICGDKTVDLSRSSWVAEDSLWYDPVHYRPLLAPAIARAVFPTETTTLASGQHSGGGI